MKAWAALICFSTLLGCKAPSSLDSAGATPSTTTVKAVAGIEGLDAYPGATEFKRGEHDEGGFHIKELGLSTKDAPEKVAAFYEPELMAKAMPTTAGMFSIQNDFQGKHYEVSYGRFGGETTIAISVKIADGK